MDALRRYTVEIDRPAAGWGDVQQVTAAARRVTDEMRGEGSPVRLLRAVFVPEDESCFFIYEGTNAAAIREAARRADLATGAVRKTILEVER
jgi:hypothetical protein